MPYRKIMFEKGGVYHVFTRSIAGYVVFNCLKDYTRMRETVGHYIRRSPGPFSHTPKSDGWERIQGDKLVGIYAYCFMPTHLHLLVSSLVENGISHFMNVMLKSYSQYFNLRYNRKGPLWEGRFKNIPVEKDEYLLYLTKYIHLNPVKAGLVTKPEEWIFSSYNDFLTGDGLKECGLDQSWQMDAAGYARFVEDKNDREMGQITHLMVD